MFRAYPSLAPPEAEVSRFVTVATWERLFAGHSGFSDSLMPVHDQRYVSRRYFAPGLRQTNLTE